MMDDMKNLENHLPSKKKSTSSKGKTVSSAGSKVKTPGADGSVAHGTSTADGPQPIWWEKTVEYLFAITYMSHYKMICPLGGRHERAGDVISGKGTKWCLIEFKREAPTSTELDAGGMRKSEKDKFEGSENAHRALHAFRKKHDMLSEVTFHHIAYGIPVEAELRIDLGAHDYWNVTKNRDASTILSTGIADKTLFVEYIKLFVNAKGGGKDDKPGSGPDGPDKPSGGDPSDSTKPPGSGKDSDSKSVDLDYMNVVAVTPGKTKKGRKIFCCPLKAFYALFNLDEGPGPGGGEGGSPIPPDGPTGPGKDGAEAQYVITKEFPDPLVKPVQEEWAQLMNEPETC